MTKIFLAIILLAALVGCGPRIEQKVKFRTIKEQCFYHLHTKVWSRWLFPELIYYSWKTDISSDKLEEIKAEERQIAESVIECLEALE